MIDSILGGISDVLSAPRRLAWSGAAQLGRLAGGSGEAYDSGADLLAGTFGMDPNSYLTQGLGLGAEMLLDPLTYAGGFLGGIGGNALRSGARAASAADKAADAATLAGRLERMAGAASAPGQALAESTIARQGSAMGEAINSALNAPKAIEPYMAGVPTAPTGTASRLDRLAGRAPSTLTPGSNPLKAAANERYLADKAARGREGIDRFLTDLPASPATGRFSGPFSAPRYAVPGPSFMSQYGPMMTGAAIGGALPSSMASLSGRLAGMRASDDDEDDWGGA